MVLSHVVDTSTLMSYYLSVPDSVIEKISKDEEQQRCECIHYYLKYSPYSMLDWGYLGGELHYWGKEEAALTATRAFIQRVPGTIYMTYGCGMCMYDINYNVIKLMIMI